MFHIGKELLCSASYLLFSDLQNCKFVYHNEPLAQAQAVTESLALPGAEFSNLSSS
jgi:hypothetical protein